MESPRNSEAGQSSVRMCPGRQHRQSSGSRRAAITKQLMLVFFGMVCAVTTGCGASIDPIRQHVEGRVTLDGRPLQRGLITFIPLANTKGPKVTGVISEGAYVIPQAEGPYPGTFRVKVETIGPDIVALASGDYHALRSPAAGEEPLTIASRYNVKSRLKARIRRNVQNVVNLALHNTKQVDE